MKKIVIIAFILVFATLTGSYAQTRDSIVRKQRLIRSIYQAYGADTIPDSWTVISLKYSGSRGSTFRPLVTEMRRAFMYERYSSIIFEPEYAHLPEPYEDAHKETMAYDTLYYDQNGWTQTKYKAHLDTSVMLNGNMTGKEEYENRIIKRDALSRIIGFEERAYRPGGVSFTLCTMGIGYDDRGYVKSDTSYDWYAGLYDGPNYLRTYEYDEKGRLVSVDKSWFDQGEWRPSWHDGFKYDQLGLLSERVKMVLYGTTDWDTLEVHTLAYDALGRLSLFKVRDYSSGISETQYSYHYNDKGEMDSLATVFSNGWHDLMVYTYNEYHNPVTQAYYGRIKPDWSAYIEFNKQEFIYELYSDTIQIADTATNLPLVIYPNPAANNVTIRWNKYNPHQAVIVHLYSSTGQLARTYSPAGTQRENALDISGIADGVYHLAILTPTGGKIYTGSLVISGH